MLSSLVRRWVTESLCSQPHRTSRRPKWASLATQGLEQRILLTAFSEFVDPNPSTGNGFGASVVVLSTGNVVITSPGDDAGATDAGAVYLFNGATGALISTLRGSHANDQIGDAGITALTNGNYVVRSSSWDNGTTVNVGAVTWGSGTTGVSGTVSSTNSLVGSTADDQVGGGTVIPLTNGNYVVRSANWDNGAVTNAGAVTWGNGTTGVVGIVSSSNSLVGSASSDQVGNGAVIPLTNGNYVVISYNWDNGSVTDAGAVTWGNGTTGIAGLISSSNSLLGSKASDRVGIGGVTALTNGNYVVRSPNWGNGSATDAGAVSWGSGTAGVKGLVSSSNSLIGSTASDLVGLRGVTALTNGNYVVNSSNWDNGSVTDAGAVTWGSGTTGITGVVSSSNSLVGSTASDQVGDRGVAALTNGNYVVNSSNWDNGSVTQAGAATWGNGTTGISGVVSSSNSLVGSTANDRVGLSITALTNGNYVVINPNWANGSATNAGAVSWGNGATGINGVVSSSNSLVGSTAGDSVGGSGVIALTNGNYVVLSSTWDNGSATNVGAVTWGNGTTGIKGVVSSSNSLVGGTSGDRVGLSGITVLTNGNYVVVNPRWANASGTGAGAVTWGSGTTGISGVVSSSNSLVGSTVTDFVGNAGVIVLTNGNYVVRSPHWANGSATDAGAVTWGSGTTGITGVVSSTNSLVGDKIGDTIGSGGVTALTNGNYVVRSESWDNGSATDAGAVTWGSGTTGITGVVSPTNSLVGSTANDIVGVGGVTALTNGNYVVRSSFWDNGVLTNAGAVIWGSGTRGVAGVITPAKSIVGLTSSTSLQDPVLVDNVNNTYISQFLTEGGGRVRIGDQSGHAPTDISLTNSQIAENSANGAVVGGLSTSDVDAGDTFTYSLVNNAGGRFGISGTNLVVANGALLNHEQNISHSVIVRVTDSEGLTFDKVFTITVTNVNEPPVISVPVQSVNLDENSANGTVVATIALNEIDAGDTLDFIITAGNEAGAFAIDGSGVITVADRTKLDFETTPTFTLNVQVSDSLDQLDTATVTVNLVDLVEYAFVSGTLSVYGTGLADTITVRAVSGAIQIEANSAFFSTGLAAGTVKLIEVFGAGENDLLTIDTSISAATKSLLRGDNGDDTLVGGAGSDTLEGGGGNDTLDGRGGIDAASYSLAAAGVQVSLVLLGASQATGGAGDDELLNIENLFGSAWGDVLTGDDGANLLWGLEGNDTLFGAGGNDRLLGGEGADELDGGDANDFLLFDSQDTRVFGGAGNDHARVHQSPAGVTLQLANGQIELADAPGSTNSHVFDASGATWAVSIVGGDGNDTLIGGEMNDTLSGGTGDDSLVGNGGNDTLVGGLGSDAFDGGEGNDSLRIDNLDASVVGGAGFDMVTVSGVTGGVSLDLTAGQIETVLATASTYANTFDASGAMWAVSIAGGSGNDTLIGGEMNDTLSGGAGDDSLVGNGGNDTLVGGLGSDAFDGGEGNDSLRIDNLDASVVGGAGFDMVTVSGVTGGVSLDLTAGQIETVLATASTYANTFDASGATWAVSIAGGSGNDTLIGGEMNDTLNGGAGDDSLVGNGGNDTLIGGLGADAFDGGEGSDALTIDNLDTSVVGGAGLDKVTVSGATGGVTLNLTTGQIETVLATASTHANLFDASGAMWAVSILGGSGNDTLIGGEMNDTLTGGAGNDSLVGYGSNDTLNGGLGADAIEGGEGNDALTIDNLDTSVIGGAGLDKVTVSGATGGVTLDLTAGQIETVLATASTYANTFDATGATWAVSIIGGSGNDTIIGGNLNDTLTGGAGDDSLSGGDGHDALTGGLGADKLFGDGGNDALKFDNLDTSVIGGAGLDTATVTAPTGAVSLNLFTGEIETVSATASTFHNLFDATGATWNVAITSGSGNDTLIGGLMNDKLTGGAGNDLLIGGDGDDTLTGGDGSDTISYETATGPVTVNLTTKKATGAAGNDTLATIENVIGSPFNDTITGDLLNNLLDGGDGILNNDTILGGGGIDSIINA